MLRPLLSLMAASLVPPLASNAQPVSDKPANCPATSFTPAPTLTVSIPQVFGIIVPDLVIDFSSKPQPRPPVDPRYLTVRLPPKQFFKRRNGTLCLFTGPDVAPTNSDGNRKAQPKTN